MASDPRCRQLVQSLAQHLLILTPSRQLVECPCYLVIADPENTEALDQLLRDSMDIPQADETESESGDVVPEIGPAVGSEDPTPLKITLGSKRTHDPQTFDEIEVWERRQSKRPTHPT